MTEVLSVQPQARSFVARTSERGAPLGVRTFAGDEPRRPTITQAPERAWRWPTRIGVNGAETTTSRSDYRRENPQELVRQNDVLSREAQAQEKAALLAVKEQYTDPQQQLEAMAQAYEGIHRQVTHDMQGGSGEKKQGVAIPERPEVSLLKNELYKNVVKDILGDTAPESAPAALGDILRSEHAMPVLESLDAPTLRRVASLLAKEQTALLRAGLTEEEEQKLKFSRILLYLILSLLPKHIQDALLAEHEGIKSPVTKDVVVQPDEEEDSEPSVLVRRARRPLQATRRRLSSPKRIASMAA
ncbi:MAG: hypothetical protein AAB553_04240 [Patescibacteria group bacterium]